MTTRAWIDRGVILVAALATIATSRGGWVVEATKLPDDPTRARIYVVEATSEPRVELIVDGNHESAKRLDAVTSWPGTARFQIPAGATIQRVLISERCTSGSMCEKCVAPSNAKIRIASITPISTWTLDTSATPPVQPTTLEPDRFLRFQIDIDASHPVRLRVDSTGPKGIGSYHLHDKRYYVDFESVKAPTSFTWTLTAIMEEPCPEVAKPCSPPADTKLSITSIARESAGNGR